MNLAEQVMPELDEKVVEQDILPVLYPILKWKAIIDKDLYESAHAATLSIFAAQKPVSRELAGGYASLLINVREKKDRKKCPWLIVLSFIELP
jgi:hypothetical protein